LVDAGVTMRSASPEDAPALAAIWHAGWRDGHLGHISPQLEAARDADSFRTRAAQRVGDATVAVINGEVAGFIMVVDDELEQMYVGARHRGTGVADVLMTDAEQRIAAAGYTTAWLAVVAGNARARRFYERRGWSDAGVFVYSAAGDGTPIPVRAHRYVRQLAQ
jgi:GNAT superfamily N-acetyltransferase